RFAADTPDQRGSICAGHDARCHALRNPTLPLVCSSDPAYNLLASCTATTTATTIIPNASSGSHTCASPANHRTGIASGAENGTYDNGVITLALSWNSSTARYGPITRVITRPMLEPRSSCLLTIDPVTAHIVVNSTKPRHRNGTNHPNAGAMTDSKFA